MVGDSCDNAMAKSINTLKQGRGYFQRKPAVLGAAEKKLNWQL